MIDCQYGLGWPTIKQKPSIWFQERFSKQYVKTPTMERDLHNLISGKSMSMYVMDVVEVSVEQRFLNSNHCSVSFKVVMDKDKGF